MFIMFSPSRRTLKPAPHESPSRQPLKLYPHETSPSTTLNTHKFFPINKRKTIEIHQKFCYANFVNQMSIRRNCDQSSIFSNSNKGTYIVQISHFNNCNSSGKPIHKLPDCIDWLINRGVFRQLILCRASIL